MIIYELLNVSKVHKQKCHENKRQVEILMDDEVRQAGFKSYRHACLQSKPGRQISIYPSDSHTFRFPFSVLLFKNLRDQFLISNPLATFSLKCSHQYAMHKHPESTPEMGRASPSNIPHIHTIAPRSSRWPLNKVH